MATLGRRHLALGVAVVLTAAALLWSSTGVLSRLAWLLVLAPLLAISVLLVALPLSVGIAAVVERSLPRAAIDRRPSSASKAGARMRFTTEAAWSVVQLRSLWDTSSSSTWTPAADSTVVNPPSTAASSSSGSGLPSLVPPLVRASIDHVLALILRDFVRSWFGRLSPSLAFPHELEQTLREALGALIDRASRVDLADVVVGRIVPLLTAHLDGFAKAETALSGASSRRSTLLGGGGPADGLADVFLVQAFGGPAVSNNSSGGLHRAISGQAVDARPAQEAHLRLLVEGILARILPERNKSPIVEILAREVVTCAVLMPVVEMLADPDFWNRLLDEQATNHIRQQKLIHQLRAALETTSTTSTDPLPGPTLPPSASPSFVPTGTRVAPPRQRAASIASSRRGISSRTKPKAFEAFVKGIGRIEGVLDVRRMRSDIEREIRRTKEQLEVSAAGRLIPTGETPFDLRVHLERLFHARSRVNRRLSQLSGPSRSVAAAATDDPHRSSSKLTSGLSIGGPTSRSRTTTSLLAILTEPSSLSYFLEFMERRAAILPVQFWLMVESFRLPLEDLDLDGTPVSDDDDDRDDGTGGPDDIERIQTARQDLGMIWETYFEEDVLGGGITERFGPPIQAFLRGRSGSRRGMLAARRSVFGAQHQVFNELEEDYFPAFKSSDLFFKALANVPDALPALVAGSASPRTSALRPPAFPHRATAPGVVGGANVHPGRLRKTGSALSSLELTGGRTTPPSPGAPLDPSLSFGKTGPNAERPTGLPSDSERGDHEPSDSIWRSTVTTSPSPQSPRAMANSHFDFLVAGDGGRKASERPPLFVEPDGLSESDDDDLVQMRRIDAIQAALTDIIAKDDSTVSPSPLQIPPVNGQRKSIQKPLAVGRRSPHNSSSATRTLDFNLDPAPATDESPTTAVATSDDQNAPPRLDTSLPNLSSTRRPSKRVFDDDSDDDDNEMRPSPLDSLLMDTQTDPMGTDVPNSTLVGILQLPGEIARVTARINELSDQETLLDALIRKAELVGNKRELALLTNSHRSLAREVRALGFQKRQWEQQERDSRLSPGQTIVSIPTAMNSVDDGGKPVTRYLIEVQQLGQDGSFAHGWVVPRRYNEFFSLHHVLREKVPSIRHLALPGKMLVTSMSSSFVDSRRAGLERYLQALVTVPEACASLDLRAFLSQVSLSPEALTPPGQAARIGPTLPRPQDLVKSLYRTVTSGLDDLGSATIGSDSILDLLSQGLTKQAGDLAALAGLASDGRLDPPGPSTLTNASSVEVPVLTDLMGLKTMGGETATSHFTAPICDLFIEVFQLKENNWLRRQAIVVILQQILGGTVERKFRDVIDRLTGPASFIDYISAFTNTLWPGGFRRPPTVLRTEDEKRRTKEAVVEKLPHLIPEIAANMIGRGNTRRGAKRLFAVLQYTKLNQSLVHSIIDELVFALFPEIRPAV